jgi:rubredoxin
MKHGEVQILFDVLQNRKQCPDCGNEKSANKRRTPIENVLDMGMELGVFFLDEEFKGVNYKHNWWCMKHGEVQISFTNLQNSKQCPECGREKSANKRRTPWDEIVAYTEKEGEPVISNESEYKNTQSKLRYMCPKHGEYPSTWGDYRYGNSTRCPICNQSKGERDIDSYLKKHKIEFIHNHPFADCRNKLPLPFDFYIPSMNTCIEYDGIQHFEAVEHFGGEEEFKNVKKRDKIKTNYCKKKGIRLVRIPYTDIDYIKDILDIKLY